MYKLFHKNKKKEAKKTMNIEDMTTEEIQQYLASREQKEPEKDGSDWNIAKQIDKEEELNSIFVKELFLILLVVLQHIKNAKSRILEQKRSKLRSCLSLKGDD